jgi:hypothetical protein
MKRLIVLSVIMAVMVLVAALVHAQAPAIDLKPTFINPTPGLYVNGWPAFTVSYPKEWVEARFSPGDVFAAGGTRPDMPPGYYAPSLNIQCHGTALPLEDCAKMYMPYYVQMGTDVKVLSDKLSQLKDGTPAWELEIEWVAKYDISGQSVKNGPKLSTLIFATKKYTAWVVIILTDDKKIGEDLKRIAYSLTFQPDSEKPVKVPPDVLAFLDMFCADGACRDVKMLMAHYSDRFLWGGMKKADLEKWFLTDPASPIQTGLPCEPIVTVFEPRGDKAYVDGFNLVKPKGDANALKIPMGYQQIINEHGQWKWFGNQK